MAGVGRIRPVTHVPAAVPQGKPVEKSGPAFRHVHPDAKRLIAQSPGGIVGGTWATGRAGGLVAEPAGLALCAKAGALAIDALTRERPGIVAAIEKLAIG